jgi:hypothetical protein
MDIDITKLHPVAWLAEGRDHCGKVQAKLVDFDRMTAAKTASSLLTDAGYTCVSVKPLYSLDQISAAKGVDTLIPCACGDSYPSQSYGAGFIHAIGRCPNCDAAGKETA